MLDTSFTNEFKNIQWWTCWTLLLQINPKTLMLYRTLNIISDPTLKPGQALHNQLKQWVGGLLFQLCLWVSSWQGRGGQQRRVSNLDHLVEG